MSSVRAEGLAYAYVDAVPVLSGVNVHLSAGFTGVVGENGAGKSTFLRLIAGELTPTEGHLVIRPQPALVLHCQQEVEAPSADVHGFAQLANAESSRLAAILALEPAQLARWPSLSPGERRRWQIAAALARAPDVLLLDEPTNHLDSEARRVLVAALRRFGGVGVVVSHDRELLEALTVATLRLHRGTARLYPGHHGVARELWRAEDAASWDARAAAQERARQAGRLLASARREHAAASRNRSTKARSRGPHDHDARTLAAKTRADWAEDRLGRRVQVLRREAERAGGEIPDAPHALELGRSVFMGFERAPRPWLLALEAPRLDAGGVVVLRDVRVRLGRDDRVHLQGCNGSGKTTLLRRLVEDTSLPRDRVLYLPQELERGEGARVLDEVRALPPAVRGRVLSVVAALGVDPERLLASRLPSPGEARKLLLALGLGRHAWAVVLDEPTNHLDLPSVERIESALASYPGAVLLVSHDAEFARRCTSRTWRVAAGRVECE